MQDLPVLELLKDHHNSNFFASAFNLALDQGRAKARIPSAGDQTATAGIFNKSVERPPIAQEYSDLASKIYMLCVLKRIICHADILDSVSPSEVGDMSEEERAARRVSRSEGIGLAQASQLVTDAWSYRHGINPLKSVEMQYGQAVLNWAQKEGYFSAPEEEVEEALADLNRHIDAISMERDALYHYAAFKTDAEDIERRVAQFKQEHPGFASAIDRIGEGMVPILHELPFLSKKQADEMIEHRTEVHMRSYMGIDVEKQIRNELSAEILEEFVSDPSNLEALYDKYKKQSPAPLPALTQDIR